MARVDPFLLELIAEEPSLSWLGAVVEDAHDGDAVVTAVVRPDQVNANGISHGGLVFALADQALAMAASTVLGVAATADASIQYLAPSRVGDTLTATARTSFADGRRAVVDVEVTVDGTVVALLRGTARAFRRP